MYKTLLLSLLSTIFVACSSTSALKYFQKDALEARSIQYTKKTDILYKNEQKVLFWATYLNNINQKDMNYKNETFIVSLYFVDSSSQNINENSYSLSLNGQKPLSIKEIDTNDEKFKGFKTNNVWGKQYLVTFKEIKKSYNLKLKLSNPNTNSAELSFEK